MNVRLSILIIILGSAFAVLLLRIIPLAFLSRFTLPKPFIKWLSYVPIAVLAALLSQSVLLTNGQINLTINNVYLIAIFPTLIVAILTRNILLTVITGIIFVAVFRIILGN